MEKSGRAETCSMRGKRYNRRGLGWGCEVTTYGGAASRLVRFLLAQAQVSQTSHSSQDRCRDSANNSCHPGSSCNRRRSARFAELCCSSTMRRPTSMRCASSLAVSDQPSVISPESSCIVKRNHRRPPTSNLGPWNLDGGVRRFFSDPGSNTHDRFAFPLIPSPAPP